LFLKDDYKRQADTYHGGTEIQRTARIGREIYAKDQNILPQMKAEKRTKAKPTEAKRHGKSNLFLLNSD